MTGAYSSLGLLVAFLSTCGNGSHLEPVPTPMGRSPQADARAALAHGDTRFLLVAGPWVWSTPGVDSLCTRRLGPSTLGALQRNGGCELLFTQLQPSPTVHFRFCPVVADAVCTISRATARALI